MASFPAVQANFIILCTLEKPKNRMKKQFLFILTLLFAGYFTVTGQILQPVKWAFDTKQIDDDEYEVIFKTTIDPGWHVYGIDIPEGGPIPTSFKFNESEDYELVGALQTPKPIEKYDNAFEMDLRYFESGATFRQKVKMKSSKPFQVTGELEYMACDDHRCLPPEYVEFAFNLPGAKESVAPAPTSGPVMNILRPVTW